MAAELIEGPRVLGLGLGLFLLVVLWSSVLAIVLVCSRLSVGAGVALSSLAFAITAIMLAVPRYSYSRIGVAAIPRNIKEVISPTSPIQEEVICPTLKKIIVCHFPENIS